MVAKVVSKTKLVNKSKFLNTLYWKKIFATMVASLILTMVAKLTLTMVAETICDHGRKNLLRPWSPKSHLNHGRKFTSIMVAKLTSQMVTQIAWAIGTLSSVTMVARHV